MLTLNAYILFRGGFSFNTVFLEKRGDCSGGCDRHPDWHNNLILSTPPPANSCVLLPFVLASICKEESPTSYGHLFHMNLAPYTKPTSKFLANIQLVSQNDEVPAVFTTKCPVMLGAWRIPWAPVMPLQEVI